MKVTLEFGDAEEAEALHAVKAERYVDFIRSMHDMMFRFRKEDAPADRILDYWFSEAQYLNWEEIA